MSESRQKPTAAAVEEYTSSQGFMLATMKSEATTSWQQDSVKLLTITANTIKK